MHNLVPLVELCACFTTYLYGRRRARKEKRRREAELMVQVAQELSRFIASVYPKVKPVQKVIQECGDVIKDQETPFNARDILTKIALRLSVIDNWFAQGGDNWQPKVKLQLETERNVLIDLAKTLKVKGL